MSQNITLGNRYVGYVKNGVFVCRRTKAEHSFRMWDNGLGFNRGLIGRFTETGQVLSIVVQYLDGVKERVLTTTPLHVALVGIKHTNTKDIADKQYILPLKEFDEKESLQEALTENE